MDEDIERWRLDEYELQREGHPVVTNRTVTLPWNALNDQLKCPVCLSIITETMTTPCMHRFCAECISKSLRFGKSQCPTCREPCSTRRILRPDPNFDKIISIIYPDKQVFERQQEELLEKIRENHNHMALVESVKDGMRSQALHRSTRVRVGAHKTFEEYEEEEEVPEVYEDPEDEEEPEEDEEDEFYPDQATSGAKTAPLHPIPSKPVPEVFVMELLLLPSSDAFPQLNRPFLRSLSDTLVGHLAYYIFTSYGDRHREGYHACEILFRDADGAFVHVADNITLHSAYLQFKHKKREPVTFYYSFAK